MSESTPQGRPGGGKTYGYQAPRESLLADASIEDDKEAVVDAFDHFLEALAHRVGANAGGDATTTATMPPPTTKTGTSTTSSGSTGSGTTRPSGSPRIGQQSPGPDPTTSGRPSTGTSGPSSDTSSPSPSSVDEAQELSLFSQREAFRMDRAREAARRTQQRRSIETASAAVGVSAPLLNPHQSDSNTAPVTTSREFAPSFGSEGRPQDRTRERIHVPQARRPETVPAPGSVRDLRPIDAYWGSFGTAVDRAAARARLDYARLESVIGTDERVRVSNTSEYPWRCVCSLLITANTGAMYIGTGWLVAPRLLMTAGHCVYMSDENGWVSQIEVIPGRDADQRPYGSVVATDFRSTMGWTQSGDSNFDYGAILLPEANRLGDQLGWFGYAGRADDYLRGITVNVSGYPGDGGPAGIDGTQWFDSRTILDIEERQITYVADTYGGQSGAPVWETTSDGARYGVAIHTFGTSVHNGGTRITGDVFNNIVAWASLVP